MDKKSVVIIGAGIAGLSAGCYAQMNGYQARIFEMHSLPGGLCTSWRRGAYTFDGCIDYLAGSGHDGMFYPIWQELGVIQNNHFLYHDEYCRYTDEKGKTVVFCLDTARLAGELKSHSPEDAAVIDELCGLIDIIKNFILPVAKAQEVMNLFDYVKMMPAMMKDSKLYKIYFKYGKISMAEFAQRFKSELLKRLFLSIWNSEIPLSMFLAVMAWTAKRTAGYPEGGSLKMARDIEKRFLSLGGAIEYKKRVDKIIVRDKKAVGVRLEGSSEEYSDIVICAADAYSAINHMLGGDYITDEIKEWYESMPLFPPYIQVSLGVARDMRNEPRLVCRKLPEPLTIAGKQTANMIIHNYSFDKTLAPEGKTPLVVRFFTEYDYWQKLYLDKARYKEEKAELAKNVIAKLDSFYPGIRDQVEVIDVATPVTYVRYTGTLKGATMSWLPTKANFMKSIAKTLPGLENFYMAGQWLFPGGGIPNALKSARDAVQIICKKDGKKFKTVIS